MAIDVKLEEPPPAASCSPGAQDAVGAEEPGRGGGGGGARGGSGSQEGEQEMVVAEEGEGLKPEAACSPDVEFHVAEFTPDWDFTTGGAKMIITGAACDRGLNRPVLTSTRRSCLQVGQMAQCASN